MAKKVKLINTKNLGKRIIPAAVDTAVATGGYLGGKILGNKISEKNPKFVKAKGPAAFVLGTLIAAVANEKDKTGKLLQNFGNGIAVYGGAEMADAFIPETTKAKIGLSGVGATDDELERLAEEAANEVDNQFSGVYDPGYLPASDDKPIDTNYSETAKSVIITPEPIQQATAQQAASRAIKSISINGLEGEDDNPDELIEKLM